jgi:DNA-directed RNA polymerase subunit L
MSINYIKKPIISNLQGTENDISTFTISNINVSIINAIRRIMINNTSTPVFNILPITQEAASHNNNIIITTNTTRLNNELIKQRLCCIPIHFTDKNEIYKDFPVNDCIVELNVENKTNSIIYATTGDFKIKNIKTDKYLNEKITKQIFPVNKQTKGYIDIVRLLPPVGDNIQGNAISLTCGITESTVNVNSMFNSTSICHYIYTMDESKVKIEEQKQLKKYNQETTDDDEIRKKINDWHAIDAKRICIDNSFDFKIKTTGVFDNTVIFEKSCEYLTDALDTIILDLNNDPTQIIEKQVDIMDDCYLIKILQNDYSIGKSLEYVLYSKYFEGLEQLKYCGFKKLHPHDTVAYIKIALKNDMFDTISMSTIVEIITDSINILKTMFNKIKELMIEQKQLK